MLEKLLAIFDADGGYASAASARLRARKGTRGLSLGGKAHILDAMQIINKIWSVDGKYASEVGIQRCWRKSSILPIDMETTINQDHGSNSVPRSLKTLSTEDCNLLCSLMEMLHVKAQLVDTNSEAYALTGSFAADEVAPTRDQLKEMAESWITIEDQPEIIDAEVEEFIEQLESEQLQPSGAMLSDIDDSESEASDSSDEEDELSYLDAESMIHRLKKNCSKLGINQEGQLCLDRFERALMKAKLAKPKKDVTLHSFFQPKNS
jgi:hypothetical protein